MDSGRFPARHPTQNGGEGEEVLQMEEILGYLISNKSLTWGRTYRSQRLHLAAQLLYCDCLFRLLT